MEARKRDREISDFLLRACHDLRAPARAVRTHSELFAKQAGEASIPGFQERLGFIIDGARRIDSLLDGLASYSVALATDPATFQPVRLDVILRLVLAKLDSALRDSRADVIYKDLPTVMGNADRLMQLFENLLRNALEHRGDAAPRIQIDAQRQGDAWLFTVQDNGSGLDADSLESVFRPFERLQANQSGGAGLGLAICRLIVERHGGKIWAEATLPGKEGATFRFTLPAT